MNAPGVYLINFVILVFFFLLAVNFVKKATELENNWQAENKPEEKLGC